MEPGVVAICDAPLDVTEGEDDPEQAGDRDGDIIAASILRSQMAVVTKEELEKIYITKAAFAIRRRYRQSSSVA